MAAESDTARLLRMESGGVETPKKVQTAAAGEQLANRIGAVDLLARCLEVRARALTDRADWTTARRTYDDARTAYQTTGDTLRVATCDLGSGWVACSEGDLDLADQHIRSGLEIPLIRSGFGVPPVRPGFGVPPLRSGPEVPPLRSGLDIPPFRSGLEVSAPPVWT